MVLKKAKKAANEVKCYIPLQKPFMVTSTKIHLTRNYLCWNQVGRILSREEEDVYVDEKGTGNTERYIDILYEDISKQKTFMDNKLNYTLGFLSN